MRIPFIKPKPPYTAADIKEWEDILTKRRHEGDVEGVDMAERVLHFYLQEMEHWVQKGSK